MGLIGLLVTGVIMVLGGGYYLFGVSRVSMTIANEAPAPVGEDVALYENLKAQANDIKANTEAKTQSDMTVSEDVPKNQTGDLASGYAPPVQDVSVPKIVSRLMNAGFSVPKKSRTIDTIVLHSSYNPNGGDPYAVSTLVKIYESYGVSAHYLIDRSGTIYRLVADQNIAYHAGVSEMADGRKNVNDFSIGIEMMNQEDTEYTKEQYGAVKVLVASLKKKYPITAVVGHSTIAPDRKTDPWNFDWKSLK